MTDDDELYMQIMLFIRCGKIGTARQAIDGNIILCMCFACWITNASDTHPEYIMPIFFPWQQWLCKCDIMSHYICTASLVQGGGLHTKCYITCIHFY
jgi:hypothetical protein